MRSTLALAVLVPLVALSVAVPASAKVPEPSLYAISWELDFKHATPKRIVVDTTAYWYLTYTVTNNTGQEQTWRPDFQMMSDNGKIIKSDRGIGIEVFDKIKATEGNHLLQPATRVAGTIHQGEDQAKDGVAIWKETNARMGTFKIFVQGLSGEKVILTDDDGKGMKGPDGLPIFLRKTLELEYQVLGDEFYPEQHEVHDVGHKWVMR
jgi:hypothetical protein